MAQQCRLLAGKTLTRVTLAARFDEHETLRCSLHRYCGTCHGAVDYLSGTDGNAVAFFQQGVANAV
jgi:hypothetical protein